MVCTHASNVTGNGLDLARIGAFCKQNGLLFVVDASQSAGVLPINMKEQNISVLCFTGHKGLFGPQGTGGLCVAEGVEIRPLKVGGSGIHSFDRHHPADYPERLEAGTMNAPGIAGLSAGLEGVEIRPLKVGGSGIHSFDRHHPADYPERLEAGTMNAPGIAGLSAGLDFIAQTGLDAIREREEALARRFYLGVRNLPGVIVYGDMDAPLRTAVVAMNLAGEDAGAVADALAEARRFYLGVRNLPGVIVYGDMDAPLRTAVVAMNLAGEDAGAVADALAEDYGICTRAGAHCAPLMHHALGTVEQGIVRFSFSYFNTEDEIDDALAEDYGICTRAGAHCAPLMHHALGTVEQGIVRFSFSYFNTEDEIDTAIGAIRALIGA